jgi:hypothetical protein
MWRLILYFGLSVLVSCILLLVFIQLFPDGGDAYGSALMVISLQLSSIFALLLYFIALFKKKNQ